MVRAFAFVGTACVFVTVAACVGGPGPLPDQGVDQTSQGGGIQGGSNEESPSNTRPPNASSSTGSSRGSGGAGSSGAAKPSPTVSVATFDTSCTQDSDCVAVYQGDACSPCTCANAAINTKAAPTYLSQLAKARSDCDDIAECAADCAAPQVGCDPNTNRCGVGVSMGNGG